MVNCFHAAARITAVSFILGSKSCDLIAHTRACLRLLGVSTRACVYSSDLIWRQCGAARVTSFNRGLSLKSKDLFLEMVPFSNVYTTTPFIAYIELDSRSYERIAVVQAHTMLMRSIARAMNSTCARTYLAYYTQCSLQFALLTKMSPLQRKMFRYWRFMSPFSMQSGSQTA